VQVWGLTGGIATGKSTVARMIQDEGVPVLDADKVARQVVEPGEPGWKQIVAAFGDGVLQEDKTLDRPKLAKVIFADPAKRRKLESITHPLIRELIGQEILGAAADGKELAFVDAALMIETGWAKDFAGVVVVDCPPEMQLERLMKRDGLTEKSARSRIGAQMPLAEKKKQATFVLTNDGNLVALRRAVSEMLQRVRAQTKEDRK